MAYEATTMWKTKSKLYFGVRKKKTLNQNFQSEISPTHSIRLFQVICFHWDVCRSSKDQNILHQANDELQLTLED